MRAQDGSGGEAGFTLIEIMASIVILSIVSLTLSGFFIQAMSYSKHNQSKTIAVQLGRNALSYLQKQPFQPLKSYLMPLEGETARILDGAECSGPEGQILCGGVTDHLDILQQVLKPSINGVLYTVTVRYQKQLGPGLKLKEEQGGGIDAGAGELEIQRYLLPIVVTVSPDTGRSGGSVQVEGYLTDESIR